MDSNTIELFTSTQTDNWQTPPDLYAKLHKEFNFDFDPCPLNSTTDGLKINWGKRNFVNPPYSNVAGFLKKAYSELKRGRAELVVFLTFANTDTNWFHDYCYGDETPLDLICDLRFIKGRLQFLNENGLTINSAMRPSILMIFTYNK